MATVKEVKLMKDGVMVTPFVLADSVYNLDGSKYKDSVYTKAQIDARKPKSYEVSGEVSYTVVNLDGMEIGDIRYVNANFKLKADGTLTIRDGYGTSNKVYLIFEDFLNYPDTPIHDWYFKSFPANTHLWTKTNSVGSDYTDILKLMIIRIA